MHQSPVREFYKGKSIFITGGTGFIGVLTIEKLLRCCDAKEIFVLIRDKKEQSWQERIRKLCKDEVFNRVREINPDFSKKIIGINGDCSLTGLGINFADRMRLIKRVNIVFHCAALINMNADLSDALNINVDGTERIIDLCHEMEQLQVLLYVSTWFSNNNQTQIDEKIYTQIFTLEHLKQLRKPEEIAAASKKLVNTYCLSKNLAEHTIKRNASDLPVVIVRPSVVIPTRAEPYVGWTNNVWGVIGIVAAISLGLWKVLCSDPTLPVPFITADTVINEMLAAAWDTAIRNPTTLSIYNCAMDREIQLTLKEYFQLNVEASQKFPPLKAIRSIQPLKTVDNFYWFRLMWFLYHTVFAVFADFVLLVQGKKPKMLKIYNKLYKVHYSMLHFSLNLPKWTANNSKALWNSMTPADREWLNFDLTTFNWPIYVESAFKGMRYFVLKDNPGTLPEARKQQAKLRDGKFF